MKNVKLKGARKLDSFIVCPPRATNYYNPYGNFEIPTWISHTIKCSVHYFSERIQDFIQI